MKTKLTLAGLLLSLVFPALASQVTIYGIVDGGVQVKHTSNGKGIDGQTNAQFANGMLEGDRIGIKGTEELGSGNRVGFALEQGFRLGSGDVDRADPGTSAAFSRQSTLSFSGNWGELAAGRMGGLSSADGTYTILDGATMGKSYNEAGLTSIYVTTPFTNNAVVYVSPEFGGAKFHAMYSNGLYDDTNKWSKNSHTYGAGLTYGSERAKGSVMYEVIDWADDYSPMSANSGDVKSKDTQIFTIGGQYRFDSFTFYGTYQYVTHARLLPDFDITLTDAAINSGMIKKGFNSHAFSVSGAFPVFGGTFKAAINYMNGKAKDSEVKSFLGASKFERLAGGIAYEYPLSKRSTLYGFGAVSVGMKGAKRNFSHTTEAGYGKVAYNTWSAGFGLRHYF